MYKKLFYLAIILIILILVLAKVTINTLSNKLTHEIDELVYKHEISTIIDFIDEYPEFGTYIEFDKFITREEILKRSRLSEGDFDDFLELVDKTRALLVNNDTPKGYISIRYKQEIDPRVFSCRYFYKKDGFKDIGIVGKGVNYPEFYDDYGRGFTNKLIKINDDYAKYCDYFPF